MEEIRKANRGCSAEKLVFYFSESFPQNFTHGALLIAECLADYYRTGELIVTEYVGKNYDPVDHHIKEFVVTPADIKILLDEQQSVQNPEHEFYQGWFEARKSIIAKGIKTSYNRGMRKQKIVEYFEEVEASREYSGYFCSIPEAISIVVLGSMCGLRNISQIHQWAESDKVSEFLKEEFGIEHIPCYYWLLSLLKLIKPESLNKCLMKWAESILPKERKGLTISLDGKTVRSTCKMKSYDSPLHIISAQISELGITFASKSVEGKSNEIPAVQQLIGELSIQECMVVADALNCQRETAETIVGGKGDYLLDAKGNQPVLEREIREYVQDESLRKTMDRKSITEKSRDRIETRTAYTTTDVGWALGERKVEESMLYRRNQDRI